jgi:outer membrane biogenesis lipoprotein LolB
MRYAQLLAILSLLLGGCSALVQRPNPQPEDTKFDESKRDWIAVFEHEIKVAMDNEDEEAYHFFMRELLVEKVRLWKEKKKNNP